MNAEMLRTSDRRRGYWPLIGVIAFFLCTGCARIAGPQTQNTTNSLAVSNTGNTLRSPYQPGQPHITDIQTIGITSSSATVTWTADNPCSGVVQWGKTTAYELSTPVSIESPGQPTVRLTALTPDTTYFYKITLNGFDGTPVTGPSQAFRTLEPLYTNSLSISGIKVSDITGNSVTITWKTEVPSIGQVEYDVDFPFSNITPPDGSPRCDHTLTLTNLIDNATYHYRVKATDPAGNARISTDSAFVTPPIPRTLATSMTRLASHCGCKGIRYGR
jgi:hypothetical protein